MAFADLAEDWTSNHHDPDDPSEMLIKRSEPDRCLVSSICLFGKSPEIAMELESAAALSVTTTKLTLTRTAVATMDHFLIVLPPYAKLHWR